MEEEKVKRWIRPSILESSSYQVQDATGLIKLDAMENPYRWPDEVKKGWLRLLENVAINRYPNADAVSLKQQLRAAFSIPPEQGLLLGNGSDEIIQIIALAMAAPNFVLLAPEPSFIMYRVIAGMLRATFIGVPLNEKDFSLNTAAMLEAIKRHHPAVIFIAWPNNPTGNLFDEKAVKEIIVNAPGIVVLDEAYQAFSGSSFMSQLGEYDNLLVMRTLSKLGLAGLRLGFLAGPECWLREFEKLRLPYNVNTLTQYSCEFILEHKDILDRQAARICHDRQLLYEELGLIQGIEVWPSAANFILFRTESIGADDVYNELRRKGVLIKTLHHSHPLLKNCLRVTVGEPGENSQCLDYLKNILS
ncbi:MAG: histidinol-phosphate transaminase [Gammaproteobacteria bacterium]